MEIPHFENKMHLHTLWHTLRKIVSKTMGVEISALKQGGIVGMAVFHSSEQLYQRLRAVFDALLAQPERVASYTRSNLVVRICLQKPAAQILLDGRQPPLEVFYGPSPGRADLEVTMEADVLHAIWLGQENLTRALFDKRVQTVGNPMRATPFIDLFRACQEIYSNLYPSDF